MLCVSNEATSAGERARSGLQVVALALGSQQCVKVPVYAVVLLSGRLCVLVLPSRHEDMDMGSISHDT